MMSEIEKCMHNAKEYGSLLTIPDLDFCKLRIRLEEIKEEFDNNNIAIPFEQLDVNLIPQEKE